jgi:3-oxoacyl-(acyl-carrier-protein) synthase
MSKAGISADDVEVVMVTGSAINDVTATEKAAIEKVWKDKKKPIVATTATRWGNMMEAGGIAEIGFLQKAYAKSEVPSSAVAEEWKGYKSTKEFNPSNKVAMILRASPYGEYSCLVVAVEA